jgi:hypothetical protein
MWRFVLVADDHDFLQVLSAGTDHSNLDKDKHQTPEGVVAAFHLFSGAVEIDASRAAAWRGFLLHENVVLTLTKQGQLDQVTASNLPSQRFISVTFVAPRLASVRLPP